MLSVATRTSAKLISLAALATLMIIGTLQILLNSFLVKRLEFNLAGIIIIKSLFFLFLLITLDVFYNTILNIRDE